MTDYTLLRHFADSWGLLAMTLFFLAAVLYVLRPGSASAHKASASIPFRHEDRPSDDCDGCGTCSGSCRGIPSALEP
jgi:cytochrome c oxidase cbb3-type subunit IV